MPHDPMCPAPGSTLSGCICADLRKRDARVRADERERIAQEIENACDHVLRKDARGPRRACNTCRNAAAIAREGRST